MSDASAPPPNPPPSAVGHPPDGATPGALPRVGWGPLQVVAGIALLVLTTLVGTVVVAGFDPDLDTVGGRIAVQLILAASLVGVAFLTGHGGSVCEPSELGLRRSVVSPFRPAALAYLVYFGCAIVIAVLIHPEQEDVTEELGYGDSALANVVVGALVIGIAPFTEELFFRGFVFAGLRTRLPFIAAAVIPSVIWALLHYTGPGTWGVVIQLAVFGLILSWLYERTGSLWPPIAVHALNNALAFAILTS